MVQYVNRISLSMQVVGALTKILLAPDTHTDGHYPPCLILGENAEFSQTDCKFWPFRVIVNFLCQASENGGGGSRYSGCREANEGRRECCRLTGS